MRARARTSRTRKIGFRPLAYEAEILNERDYLLHLPNGETVSVMYDDNEGPTLHVILWPGDTKTFIDAKNKQVYNNAKDLR